jgi:hypothetical protein
MGKNVQVKYTGEHTDSVSKRVCRDMTIGEVYTAYLPDVGEVDHHGLPVSLSDELWITADDAGDTVVTELTDGFELVE